MAISGTNPAAGFLKSLLGFNGQPDPYQQLLGGYYDPAAERRYLLGGMIKGLGYGLSTGDWRGANAVSSDTAEQYKKQALAAYGIKQAQDDRTYQREQDAKNWDWKQKQFEEDAKRYGMDYALRKQELDSQNAWNSIARGHQQQQWAQEDQLRQGQQNYVTNWLQGQNQMGANLPMSPGVRDIGRAGGVEGPSMADQWRYNNAAPFAGAQDYGNAFNQITAQPPKPEQFTLGAGQVRKDEYGNTIAEGPPKEENPDNNPFTNAAKLRKEFMDESKPYTDLRTNYQKIRGASQDQTGASDIALVYSFMKMLDPTSVVREGEFATAANSGGVDAKVVSLYNGVLNGQKLSPQVRQEFVQQAARQYSQQFSTYEQIKKKYEGLAQQYGLDPSVVAPDITYGVAVDPAINLKKKYRLEE